MNMVGPYVTCSILRSENLVLRRPLSLRRGFTFLCLHQAPKHSRLLLARTLQLLTRLLHVLNAVRMYTTHHLLPSTPPTTCCLTAPPSHSHAPR